MERDAKGRFVKKGDTTTQAKAKTKATKKAVTRNVYSVDFDALPDEIKTLIKDMEAHGFTCAGADVVEFCEECADKQEEIAAEVDKIFRAMDASTGTKAPDNILYGFGACVRPTKGKKNEADFSAKVLESLSRAREKLKAKETEADDTTEGTPIQWKLAEPAWINDLYEIYEDGSIPETEEDMRAEIISLIHDTARVIMGYMCYLEAKDNAKAQHTCKCGGKCKGRK